MGQVFISVTSVMTVTSVVTVMSVVNVTSVVTTTVKNGINNKILFFNREFDITSQVT